MYARGAWQTSSDKSTSCGLNIMKKTLVRPAVMLKIWLIFKEKPRFNSVAMVVRELVRNICGPSNDLKRC